ncbi:MAG TPA: extracellular solute-binding protein [Xanthobacteraceae bacterium]|jgi:iron(III) transport system substrate-binding protein|nr:extracellular solute-binding protein [Xanthobacteraceae bacterium]
MTSTVRRVIGATRLLSLAAVCIGTLITGAHAEDWKAIEAASQKEGRVLVYSTLRPENWKPIIAAFQAKYNWLKLETLRVGSHNEAFERYRAEAASGTRTADIVLASSVDRWSKLSTSHQLIDFTPEHIGDVPEPFRPKEKGYYTFAVEPQIFVYNKLLLPPNLAPKGMNDLANKVAKNPAVFKGRISSYNPLVSPFAYSIYWSLLKHHGADEFWKDMNALGPAMKMEATTGAQVDKILTGEYLVGFVLPETLLPKLDATRGKVLSFVYPEDGTPLSPRSMAVMKGGQDPNAAKLLINFLLSREGQVAMAKGGTTVYWPGVEKEADLPTLAEFMASATNTKKIADVTFFPEMESQRQDFTARMKKALGQ